MHAVILSGGIGSRLWPISTHAHPKPFIKMPDGLSLLQKVFLRTTNISFIESITTIANYNYILKIKEEYDAISNIAKQIVDTNFIAEPFGKNTAAAITSAALYVDKRYGSDELMLILPADHIISQKQAFENAVQKASNLAKKGKIVTFGIKPDNPETGFGYIECNGIEVKKFVEKPNKELAQKYIDNGNFLWNSGIFCFTAKTFLQEMEKYNPLIVTYVNSSMPHLLNKNHKDIELNSISFNLVPEESIDYALMEKTDKLKVVACNIGWKDVGTWKSLGDLPPADAFGNRIKGKAILHNVSDCYIENNGQLIGAVGVKNLAIIGTEDGFLVTNKESAEEVKNIYSKLHIKNNIKEFFWGKIIPMKEISGMRFNRIEINIGVMVDLKKYFKYSANWIVLKGEAQFFEEGVRSTEMIINSSKYIRNGHKILLNNIGKSTLIMITIELDDYLCKNAIIAS